MPWNPVCCLCRSILRTCSCRSRLGMGLLGGCTWPNGEKRQLQSRSCHMSTHSMRMMTSLQSWMTTQSCGHWKRHGLPPVSRFYFCGGNSVLIEVMDHGCMHLQEASIMAALRHPNVVMYLGICTEPACVVTEYCARGSLTDVLRRARCSPAHAAPLDWPRRINMALDAAKVRCMLSGSAGNRRLGFRVKACPGKLLQVVYFSGGCLAGHGVSALLRSSNHPSRSEVAQSSCRPPLACQGLLAKLTLLWSILFVLLRTSAYRRWSSIAGANEMVPRAMHTG
jgi:Protein tyrosine and serine/threonine kinase